MFWWKTLWSRAFQLVLVWSAQLLIPQPACAGDGGMDLLSAETLTIAGDLRVRAGDGEASWLEGGFGKLRYGGGDRGELAARPELAEAALVWQPRFNWSLAGTVVAVAEGGPLTQAGLSEAYVGFKPLGERQGQVLGPRRPDVAGECRSSIGGRNGPSPTRSRLRRSTAGWARKSRCSGIEATGSRGAGRQQDSRDARPVRCQRHRRRTVAFRGWALHDRKALAFRKQPPAPAATR